MRKPSYDEVTKLIKNSNHGGPAEKAFVLAWREKTRNMVWDSSVGRYGAWVPKKQA